MHRINFFYRSVKERDTRRQEAFSLNNLTRISAIMQEQFGGGGCLKLHRRFLQLNLIARNNSIKYKWFQQILDCIKLCWGEDLLLLMLQFNASIPHFVTVMQKTHYNTSAIKFNPRNFNFGIN